MFDFYVPESSVWANLVHFVNQSKVVLSKVEMGERSMMMRLTENTHLLYKEKYHHAVGLPLYYFWFGSFATLKLSTDLCMEHFSRRRCTGHVGKLHCPCSSTFFVSTVGGLFLKLIYHGAGMVVRLLLLQCSMINVFEYIPTSKTQGQWVFSVAETTGQP